MKVAKLKDVYFDKTKLIAFDINPRYYNDAIIDYDIDLYLLDIDDFGFVTKPKVSTYICYGDLDNEVKAEISIENLRVQLNAILRENNIELTDLTILK